MKSKFSSNKLLWNKVGGDESYTPAYAVKPILKFIPKNATIWCPFDKPESEFVKQISSQGNQVIYSHIDINDGNFFKIEPKEDWDIIISNPPFQKKREFFERALSFGKPICLWMTCAWLNDKYSKWVFKETDREMQLLMFDKRIHFEQNGVTKKKTTFSSAYFCSDFLPKQIIIEELKYE